FADEGCTLTIVCRMLRGTYDKVPLFVYIATDDLPQTEPFLYQAGDGADQPDRIVLYCRVGEDCIGAPRLCPAFFRDASSAGQLPRTALSPSQKRGLDPLRPAIGRFAGGAALSRGFADQQPGRRLAAIQRTGDVFGDRRATLDLGKIPYPYPAADDLCKQCYLQAAGDRWIGDWQCRHVSILAPADARIHSHRYLFPALLPQADHSLPGSR